MFARAWAAADLTAKEKASEEVRRYHGVKMRRELVDVTPSQSDARRRSMDGQQRPYPSVLVCFDHSRQRRALFPTIPARCPPAAFFAGKSCYLADISALCGA
ncbi:MAG TPA: hypothetical protein VGM85_08330 [Paraburkholderia sp.]|jgi:hypothetical protein